MSVSWMSLAPALALLALLGALAWVVQWLRRRLPTPQAGAATLRVLSQLMVGPQQRVVVVELDGPGGPVQLTLGVTPQHVRTLHVRPLGGTAKGGATGGSPGTLSPQTASTAQAPDYASIAQALQAEPARQGASPGRTEGQA